MLLLSLCFSANASWERCAYVGAPAGTVAGIVSLSVLFSYLRTSQFIDGPDCPPPQNIISYCCQSTSDGGFNSQNCSRAASFSPIVCPPGSVAQCQFLPGLFSPPSGHYTNFGWQIATAVIGGVSIAVSGVSVFIIASTYKEAARAPQGERGRLWRHVNTASNYQETVV